MLRAGGVRPIEARYVQHMEHPALNSIGFYKVLKLLRVSRRRECISVWIFRGCHTRVSLPSKVIPN